jgi:hypothetical protein
MHLGRNPTHGGPTGEYWHGEWVLKPNTVETFRHLPATDGRRALRVTHDTVAQNVHISGPTQVTLDTSPVADEIVGEPDYELRGDYLIVSFDRASG